VKEAMFKINEKARHWFVVGPLEERLLTQWVTAIMMLVHWGLGIAILVGGPARFTLPSYDILLTMVGGRSWIWGLTIMFSATLLLLPFKWGQVLGLFIGLVWMNLWMAGFAISVVYFPTAAATPEVAYAGFAMINAALLTARVLDKDE
jgi:hypothetical protein